MTLWLQITSVKMAHVKSSHDTFVMRSAGATTTCLQSATLGSDQNEAALCLSHFFRSVTFYLPHKPTYATTPPKQHPKAPSPPCIGCRLYLLHPVWSFSSVTALVKHPHASTWHVPSTANLPSPNLLTWSRRLQIACRISRDVFIQNRCYIF